VPRSKTWLSEGTKTTADYAIRKHHKRRRRSIVKAMNLRRFFMPNIDKLVKNLFAEIADGKEIMKNAVRNQEIIIAQNKQLIDALEQIVGAIDYVKGK